MNDNIFYKYYDAIFESKDYSGEIALLREICGIAPGHRILEIGTGTGNHTLALLQAEFAITSLDTDPKMVALAREKLKKSGHKENIIIESLVEDLNESGFDAALALFNVITYIDNPTSLRSFFTAISTRLMDGSWFVFDCWNGIAALRDPPGSKESNSIIGDSTLNCKITSLTDFWRQKTTLSYEINVKDLAGTTKESGSYELIQHLWTPEQVTDALQSSGFSDIRIHPQMKTDRVATANDWKIMFACRKG